MVIKRALFVLVQYEIIVITSPSIAGVTYRDHFDFEERYSDVKQCDPFYWHPLHLPEHCAKMYEKLIRSKIGLTKKKSKKNKNVKTLIDKGEEEEEEFPQLYELEIPKYEADSSYEYDYYEIQDKQKSPFAKVLGLLKDDISKVPSAPSFEFVPGIGPATLYRQPVSRNSADQILAMGRTYAKALREFNKDMASEMHSEDPFLYAFDSRRNHTYSNTSEQQDKPKNNIRMKSKHGDLVSIIETQNYFQFPPT